MSDFQNSYLGQLRAIVGSRKLISPGVRAVIKDDEGKVLFIRRRDNQKWVLPAGGIELEESVYDCLKREVREETGLEVLEAFPFAIYSEPRFAFVSPSGDKNQMLDTVFCVTRWSGNLENSTDESIDARFFFLSEMDDVHELFVETLADLNSFKGSLILK